MVLTGARSGLRTETASFHIAPSATLLGHCRCGPAARSGVPSLADTGRDSRQTVLELAIGLGLS